MEAGDYRIKVTQSLKVEDETHDFMAETQVAVMGDRFDLHPNVIQSVFPPANARGDFWHVLPHVILSRSTLPWERSACDALGVMSPPWLALLVFDEDEMKSVPRTTVTAQALEEPGQAGWPAVDLQTGQHKEDPVTVIDVPWKLLKNLAPENRAAFGYRTHVRRVFPHALQRKLHFFGRGLQAVRDNFDNLFKIGAIKNLFLHEGIDLGDLDQVIPQTIDHTGKWKITSPSAGTFTITYTRHESGNWMRIVGGPPADPKATVQPRQYDFIAIDLTLAEMLERLVPLMKARRKGQKAAKKADRKSVRLPVTVLPEALRRELPAMGDRAYLSPDSGASSQTGDPYYPKYWRITDADEDHHFLLKIAHSAEGGFAELDGYGEAGTEQAVIVANRLPKPGKKSTVHLVSLENRYSKSGEDCILERPETGQSLRLVSLKSWDFLCLADRQDFKTLLEQTNLDANGNDTGALLRARHDLGEADSTARSDAARYLDGGHLPLRHQLRQGQQTVSWYHGPLVPYCSDTPMMTDLLPARAADALVVYDKALGMFDMSYAAAWEIGRLATLANTSIALKIFNWKRAHAQHLNAARHLVDLGQQIATHQDDLSASARAIDAGLPDNVAGWFHDLSLLRHVPFNYLVPDEDLLPLNSIRFFDVDPRWTACLRDGAFSIGRVLAQDKDRPENNHDHLPDAPPVSGFLLRSEVVTDYPGFVVDAYGTAVGKTGHARDASHLPPSKYKRLPCVRREAIGRGLMICLFEGTVRMVDMHRQPEIMHFGLNIPDHVSATRDPLTLVKKLRRDDGEQIDAQVSLDAASGLIDKTSRVVDLDGLAAQMAIKLGDDCPRSHLPPGTPEIDSDGLNPAVFALEMIAASELVRFVRRDAHVGDKS